MTRQGIPGVPTAEKAAIYLKAGACASVAGVLGLIWLPSDAEAARTPRGAWSRLVADHNHDGNGHHNATALSVRSPVRNRGYQHTTNRNAGGVNDAQNALCRNVRVCNVTQKVTVVSPERTTTSAADATAPPHTPVAPSGPLVYMGPYGLMLAGGDPAGPASCGGTRGQSEWFECPANFLS
ncbi:hypothetical protein NE236_17260 [Actinoallomurus purpureus]|uniref:hypothetical protein n=1 Tax=Actinoallomurus purpureus TaxID=478114 RepID=UPI0020927676|nr:hypothetical protein [Actinoallomurus purpureus]MCO6006736.1 hypothetical protein [Actinoallomurus purpureus]